MSKWKKIDSLVFQGVVYTANVLMKQKDTMEVG